ncbi:hypothetical protein [Sphingobacterium sp.]|uniref:hypothetical protein n=1 Tax=Sphingobacterium sp. TaxID=341027 RepID=UPI0031D5A213
MRLNKMATEANRQDYIRLEQYFDEKSKIAWDNMVYWAESYWTESVDQKLLEENLDNKSDIAKVIFAKLREGGLDWIDRKIPALDNLSPKECLNTSDGIKRLKEGLLRMDI